MAQLAGVRHTYMDTTRREDLMDEIMDISPDANYLTTTLSSVEVSQTLHEWTEMYVSRDSSNDKAVEGDDNSYSDLGQPTKRNNITQIIKKPFSVSETDIAVSKVSPKDAYAREMNLAMRRWKNSAEYAVIRGTKASGSSGVARETEGFINATINNGGIFVSAASGTSLTEDYFNSRHQSSYDATDAFIVDLIMTNGSLKRDLSKLTAGNTKNIDAQDKRLVNAIEVYETDFGITELRAHKDMPAGVMLGLRKELCKVGYLRRPKHKNMSVTGDNMKGHVVGELLAQADSSRSHFVVTGLRAGLS